ncbi:tyrosine-type recombinase/integrase [Muricomes sp. OA1]|uniref:tyrosine-type recombinase/integrase n=1 Tax=Muricomes sp. OA1 TaxID=2914165 RepID=UPI0004702B99|nr:site-specific integrase [Muricomes sp. OA1]MCH1972609.1 tyrosine-type recombinase/integrase [Muricomes sp. OA1]
MNTQTIKSTMRDAILVTMAQYLDKAVLRILENVIEEQFIKVNMEEITTLPAEVNNSIDEQNKYVIQLFLIKKEELKEETKYNYLNAIKKLLDQIDKPLVDMTDIDIKQYLRWYEKRNVDKTGKINMPSTVNNERRYLSAFFNWMRIEKLMFDNPVESVGKKRTDKGQIDYYTQEELEKLREGCQTKRDRAMIEVLRSTGLRVGEFCSINISDVDFRTGDVWIKREKGGLNTPAFIDEAAMYYLREYLNEREDDCESLIVGKRAPYSRLKPCGVRAVLKDIARRQGMSCKVYPHKFRKTLGMTLKNKGYDLGVIQEVLGHTSPATTSKYYAESTSDTLRSIRRKAA